MNVYLSCQPILGCLPTALATRITNALWHIPRGATKGSTECQKLRELFIYEATRYITREQYHPIDRLLRPY